jgi:hypothetical protein
MTLVRALGFVLILCVMASACGHYGPPTHSSGTNEKSGAPAIDPTAPRDPDHEDEL